jgi:uncharacterized repeat protein (TIGR02543 family)
VTTPTVTLANPTKTGYAFGGWFTASDFSGSAVTSIPLGSIGNKAFFAKWTPVYTITYDGNGNDGGSAPVDAGLYITGANVNVLAQGTLLKSGSIFTGWNTALDGSGTPYAAGATLTIGTTNVTLYAQWLP